jgi:hypothetical protein
MGVVDEPIEDGIGIGRVADDLVPFVDRDLAGQDGRAAAVAFFEDLVEIAAGAGVERIETPIIEDQELRAIEAAQDAGVTAIAASQCEIGEELGDPLIEHRAVIAAEAMGRRRGETPSAPKRDGPTAMPEVDDLSRSIAVFDQTRTLLMVVEMSQTSWLIAGMVPGLQRSPVKKLDADPAALIRLIERWRSEAEKAGRPIERITLAFEAGRDGFWLARWLSERDIGVHVIHSTSVAVTREHRRAKTDRLDTAMLMRVFLGWLRGERGALPHGGNPDAGGGRRQTAEPGA